MKRSLPCLLFLSLSLPSQIFTDAALTSSPMTVTCAVPGHTSVVNTVPAGTPAGAVWLQPGLFDLPAGSAQAQIDGQYLAFESSLELGVAELVAATGSGTTTLAPHDYTLTLQSSVPTPVLLEIGWFVQMDAGQTMPLVQVDIGDDGVIDFQGFASGQQMTVPLVIGPTPFRLRTHTAMSASQGSVNSSLTCRVTPVLATFTNNPGTGCSGPVQTLATFEHEIVLRMNIPIVLTWVVIGFTPTPTPVQLPFGATCPLTTTPDIVVPLPQGELRIDLLTAPPGPFTFFVQGLILTPATLAATTRTIVHVL